MDDPKVRMAQLSPERARLLEQLAKASKSAAPKAEPAPPPRIDEQRFAWDEAGSLTEKTDVMAFYDAVSGQLDASEFAEFSLFLNYGYVPNDGPSFARVPVPERTLSQNAVRLVLELVGEEPLGVETRLLDVGCGRGGTISVLRRFFAVGPVVGLDLSSVAIAFCQRTHHFPHTTFVQGDAEGLPFASASFDVLTNVESSHAYPHPDAFFAEAARVLAPGGAFLYTDLVGAEIVAEREALLAGLGLVVEHRRDITSNVLLSCDETAASHAKAFRADNSSAIMGRFLGVRGTALYDAMKDGTQKYLLYRFRRGAA